MGTKSWLTVTVTVLVFVVLAISIPALLMFSNPSHPQDFIQGILRAASSGLGQSPSSSSPASCDPPPLPSSSSSCTHKGNSSCCLECDIADLRIGRGNTLLGCPQLNYRVEPAVLAEIAGLDDKKGVWIATISDSVLRSPYQDFPRGIMGSEWWKSMRVFNLTWYHNDQVFCCGDTRDVTTCMYGRRNFEFQETVDLFVQKFLSSNGAHSLCSSFSFQVTVEIIRPVLRAYMNHSVVPLMVITNPGLHHISDSRPPETPEMYRIALLELFGDFAELQRERSQASPNAMLTTLLFYTTTMVNDTKLAAKNKTAFHNHIVLSYNEVVTTLVDQLRDTLREARIRVVDGYRLTSMGDVTQKEDGFHYTGHFNDHVNMLWVNFLMDREVTGFCSSPSRKNLLEQVQAHVSVDFRPLIMIWL